MLNQSQNVQQEEDLFMENNIFSYKKYPNTYFVPVYPQAYVEQIIGIDYDRRTVTARFVIHITINLKFNEQKKFELKNLKQYIRNHIILQFGYNQIIYIPEIMIRDNPQYIINQVLSTGNTEDYVTYKIKGNFECGATFDYMFFPYRQIEVVNHLVIRSQVFEKYHIKYNAMLIHNKEQKVNQFSPFIYFPEFAGFRIMSFSTQAISDRCKYNVKKTIHKQQLLSYLVDFILNKRQQTEEVNLDPQQMLNVIMKADYNDLEKISIQLIPPEDQNLEILEELSPYKHIVFKFDMMSLKLAYVFQNETPIWVLSVLCLYAFTSPCDISNKYGNIVLLIVSFVALLTNFRLNNVSHPYITFFELKLILIYSVPIMLIISTVLDYYSNPDPTKTTFALRKSQIQNPFMLASLIIVIINFFITLIFFLYVALTRVIFVKQTSKQANRNEFQGDQFNIQEYEWRHLKLCREMSDLIQKDKSCIRIEDKKFKNALNKLVKKNKKPQQPQASFHKVLSAGVLLKNK